MLTSDLISSKSTWVSGYICCFFGRLRRRPVLVSGVHANFLTHVSAKAASTALTCEDCGVRFISRRKYKIQAWRHVHDSVCTRLPLALVEAVLGLGFSQRRGRAAGSRPATPARNMSGTPCSLRERRRFSRPPVGGRRRRRNDRFYIGPKFCATVARRPPRLGAAGSAGR